MNTINKTVDVHAHPVDEVFRREIEHTDTYKVTACFVLPA